MLSEFFAGLGFKAQDLVAAFLGSLASTFFMPAADRRQVVATIFVGMVAGNYLGEWIADLANASRFRGGICVLIGFTAMVLGKRVLDKAATMEIPWIGGKPHA